MRIDQAGKDEFTEQQQVRKRVYEWEKKNEKDIIRDQILKQLELDEPLYYNPSGEESGFIETARRKF